MSPRLRIFGVRRFDHIDKEAWDAEKARRKSKKDTRKWCKGVEGRKHRPVIEISPFYAQFLKPGDTPCGQKSSFFRCHEQEVCVVCKKILRWDLGENCTYRDQWKD